MPVMTVECRLPTAPASKRLAQIFICMRQKGFNPSMNALLIQRLWLQHATARSAARQLAIQLPCTHAAQQRAGGIVRCYAAHHPVAESSDSSQRATTELPPPPVSLVASLQERSTQSLDPGLHVVPTPIGNLEDITLRALRVLQAVSMILAEDTRHTRRLLQHFGINTPLLSLHEHNEFSRVTEVVQQLEMGASLALVSDAGMPAISDPGSHIISAAIAAGHRVIPLPGASAVVSALVASGLPADDFRFVGFLPPKSGVRRRRLQELSGAQSTLVLYVPPHSLAAVLADAAEVLGGSRRCVIARELTKMNEEFHRSLLQEAAAHYHSLVVKGEITLLISGADPDSQTPASEDDLKAVVQRLLDEGQSPSAAAKLAAAECGVPKRAVYSLTVQLSEQKQPSESGEQPEASLAAQQTMA